MAIPESQLETWSHQGGTQGSADTYTSIKNALESHSWPAGMNFDVYLQGSYPNATNIRGDSDVDVIVETSNVFYHNARSDLYSQLGFTRKGSYSWSEFRDEVKNALTNYYGFGTVSQEDKCLRVVGKTGSRLNADVVPCNTYKHYRETTHIASGITFWTTSNVQIINYPKLHLANGRAKNSATSSTYKPAIRVIKNARNAAAGFAKYPSYFVECLLSNLPERCFDSTHQTTFKACIESLRDAADDNSLPRFMSQNGVQPMFGTAPHQSNVEDATRLINQLIDLWNDWNK